MEGSPDYIGGVIASWNRYGNVGKNLFSMFITGRYPSEPRIDLISGKISDDFGTGNFYGHLGREFIKFKFEYMGDAAIVYKKCDEPYHHFFANLAYGPNVSAFLKRHSENHDTKILSQIVNELRSDLEGLMIGEIIPAGKEEIPFYIYPTILNDERLDVYSTFMEGMEL